MAIMKLFGFGLFISVITFNPESKHRTLGAGGACVRACVAPTWTSAEGAAETENKRTKKKTVVNVTSRLGGGPRNITTGIEQRCINRAEARKTLPEPTGHGCTRVCEQSV